jgi:ClpP class serine protease
LMQKLGVESRVHTAGESKSTNNPFKPEKAEDVAKLKSILEEMHVSFKTMVRERRGVKLKGKDKELFTGAYWTGKSALALGLIDGLGHMEATMKRKFGDKAVLKQIPVTSGGFLRRIGFGNPSDMGGQALDALEARALWQRFGL